MLLLTGKEISLNKNEEQTGERCFCFVFVSVMWRQSPRPHLAAFGSAHAFVQLTKGHMTRERRDFETKTNLRLAVFDRRRYFSGIAPRQSTKVTPPFGGTCMKFSISDASWYGFFSYKIPAEWRRVLAQIDSSCSPSGRWQRESCYVDYWVRWSTTFVSTDPFSKQNTFLITKASRQ